MLPEKSSRAAVGRHGDLCLLLSSLVLSLLLRLLLLPLPSPPLPTHPPTLRGARNVAGEFVEGGSGARHQPMKLVVAARQSLCVFVEVGSVASSAKQRLKSIQLRSGVAVRVAGTHGAMARSSLGRKSNICRACFTHLLRLLQTTRSLVQVALWAALLKRLLRLSQPLATQLQRVLFTFPRAEFCVLEALQPSSLETHAQLLELLHPHSQRRSDTTTNMLCETSQQRFQRRQPNIFFQNHAVICQHFELGGHASVVSYFRCMLLCHRQQALRVNLMIDTSCHQRQALRDDRATALRFTGITKDKGKYASTTL